jgi:membrane protein
MSLKEIASRTWAEIRTDDVFGKSAQLAYYFFLALFPFLICVIASLSIFGSADRGRTMLLDLFARSLPMPAFQLISTTFDEIIRSGGPLKMSFGILGSLWSASMGMGAVMDTLNAAYRVKETRSLSKQYAVAIGLTCGIGVLLVLSIVTAIYGGKVIAIFSGTLIGTVVLNVVRWLMVLAVILLAFSITYYFAPNIKERQWHWITPGAVVGIILLIIVSTGLRVYLSHFPTYNATYGSLGAVISLLLYFYLSGAAVLSGAALNGVLQQQSEMQPSHSQHDTPPAAASASTS